MQLAEMQFNARSCVIASIFPFPCSLTRNYGPTMAGGRTTYLLESAPKGEHRTLKVFDCFERQPDFNHPFNGIGHTMSQGMPVSALEIARDCITHWAVSRIGTAMGFRPGIQIIAGEVPTEAELASMTALQRGYFEGLFQQGQEYAAKHKWTNINEFHRGAAKWLGLDEKWVADVGKSQEWKHCSECYEKIDARANVCRVCRSTQKAIGEDAPQVSAPTNPGPPRPQVRKGEQVAA